MGSSPAAPTIFNKDLMNNQICTITGKPIPSIGDLIREGQWFEAYLCIIFLGW